MYSLKKLVIVASLFKLGGNKMWALITGASSGIGMEAARIFAKNGYNLFLVARRSERLEGLKLELGTSVEVVTAPLDLSMAENIDELFLRVEELDIDIDVLVNNAGVGEYGEFMNSDIEKQIKIIDLNVKTLTHIARVLGDKMKKRGCGTIVNVASTAAFQAVPYMAVYGATKSYVLSFSLALSAELEESGVTVVAFCPGATKTEFQKVGSLKTSKFRGKLLGSETVAKLLYKAAHGNRRLVVTGVYNKLLVFSSRLMPRYFIAKLVKKSYEA